MRRKTVHRVDGVGHQVPADTGKALDPQKFEQAIHGLQDALVYTLRENDQYDPDHESDHERVEEDGEQKLALEPDSFLEGISERVIPSGWNQSIVTDKIRDEGYGVRGSVDCGGGVLVLLTVFVENGAIRRVDIAHNKISNPDEFVKVTDFTSHTPTNELTHTIRWLEQSVTQAYAATIPSAAAAFDYIATKDDAPSYGTRRLHDDPRHALTQRDWASVRDKTEQTISNNVSTARESLTDPFKTDRINDSGPAMTQGSEDDERHDGGIRLV